jgi:hypothetical protein
MDKQTKVMDTVEMNFTPIDKSIEKPIQELFDECLSFISINSFEI